MQDQTTTHEPGGQRRVLFSGLSWGAIAISAGVAGIGVSGIVGWLSPYAVAGSAALIGGTIVTEIAAAHLPNEAQKRAQEGGLGGWLKAIAVVGGFGLLTAWNVTAGHMGMQAINLAGVADKRAPLERTLAREDAALRQTLARLEAFDAETARRAQARQATIMGADGRYITARSRAMDEADRAADEREAARAPLLAAIGAAEAAKADAEVALRSAPAGRPDHELWAFALILELCKGALAWFATPVRRHIRREGFGVTTDKAAYGDMTIEELEAVLSLGRTSSALAQQVLRRLGYTREMRL